MTTHITVPNVIPRIQYIADGALDTFTYPFPIFTAADLQVYFDEIPQTTGFTVTNAGESGGGTVVFDAPPAADTRITLRRYLTVERRTDFQESGEFRAKVINDELDFLTASIQQVIDDLSRTISLSPSDGDAGIVLPDKAVRSRKAVIFDENGNLTASKDDFDQLSASASDARASADDAAASASNAANAASNARLERSGVAGARAAAERAARNAIASAAAIQAAPVNHGTHLYLLSQGFGANPSGSF